ncbi:MAG: uroporphyrinogen-III C-methyltransferase [Candidatus Competibacterales bacterium]
MDDWSILQAGLGSLGREVHGFAPGSVALIGAGPGDPELLTLKALRLLKCADVVLYDHLVSDEVADWVGGSATWLYVGKTCGRHALSQDQINAAMIDRAQRGQRVCRLKGGDPFVFGRGGEELEALAKAGVAYQVVPGITAAAGCAAYAGIPLTHRDYVTGVTFVTGHRRDHGPLTLDWQQLVDGRQTLVFYMGLKNLALICAELQAHGMDPAMPAAVVENGTRPDQRVVTGTLADLPAEVQATEVAGPSLVIVGEVVGLQGSLAWFMTRQAAVAGTEIIEAPA